MDKKYTKLYQISRSGQSDLMQRNQMERAQMISDDLTNKDTGQYSGPNPDEAVKRTHRSDERND